MQNDTSELVTIGIICHNAQDTIERAITSCVNQTWKNIEIIVLDDCSEDKSVQNIKTLIKIHPQVKILQNTNNKGVAFNRHKIMEQAQGEYLCFLDDDDWALPDRVERQVRRINDIQQTIDDVHGVLCYGDRIQITQGRETGIVHGIGRNDPPPHGLAVAEFILADIRQDGYQWGAMGAGTMMAKTELLKRLGGFDQGFKRAAEIDLALRASWDPHIYFASVPTPVIHQHITVSSEKTFIRRGYYELKLAWKHRKIIAKCGIFLPLILKQLKMVKKGLFNTKK